MTKAPATNSAQAAIGIGFVSTARIEVMMATAAPV